MLGTRHPFTHALYERDGEGNILVTETDGRWGRFRKNGQWIEGEVREADPHLCGWVGGPVIGNHRLVDQQQTRRQDA
ncbi:unannotated protein [freshwater metagenome]|jgi:hypothetical protein|uniref:Unannotated protein n=1 Tax=freshwater metagenome TaxID=449393 RepID=A0A6J6DI67_9ZZZZ